MVAEQEDILFLLLIPWFILFHEAILLMVLMHIKILHPPLNEKILE